MDVELPDVERVERRAVGRAVILRSDNRDLGVGFRFLLAVNVRRQQTIADQRQHIWIIPIDEKADCSRVR